MSQLSLSDRFGIKLIWPTHLDPKFTYFERAGGTDLPALMNFKNDEAGYKLASGLPLGHRCLVYVTELQLFIWAIELIGTVEEGEAARRRHGIKPKTHHPFTLYRPIRFLARVVPWHNGPRREKVVAQSNVPFQPLQGDSHVVLSEDQYLSMYRSIEWTEQYE